MSIKEQLRADVKAAMQAGETDKRDALRLLLAAIKQEEIDSQTTLDDAGVQAVLTKQAKQRRESIADYQQAGRPEMAAQEENELALIEQYLPQMMSREEVRAIASKTITEMGVTDVKEMGRVMGKLMPELKGKADGRIVNEVVRDILQRP